MWLIAMTRGKATGSVKGVAFAKMNRIKSGNVGDFTHTHTHAVRTAWLRACFSDVVGLHSALCVLYFI